MKVGVDLWIYHCGQLMGALPIFTQMGCIIAFSFALRGFSVLLKGDQNEVLFVEDSSLAGGLCCTTVLCLRGPVAWEVGSCVSPDVPRAERCCNHSLPDLACVQPCMIRGRRFVFRRHESHAAAVALLFEQTGEMLLGLFKAIKEEDRLQ